MKEKNKTKDILFAFLFLIGLCLLTYPLFADYVLNTTQSADIEVYDKMKKIPDERLQEIEQWNRMLEETDAIEKQSDFNHSQSILPNIIAMLEIPKIKLKSPIYFSTSDLVLSKGVGILEGTNLPMGGNGKHSVLSAHRGLSLGKMFTDLPKLELGDLFYINVFGDTLAYKVDQIKTVLPDETRYFEKNPDKDYVTLLTCTPIGINTHRLLVRGHRVPYNESAKELEKSYFWTFSNILKLLISIVFVGIVSIFLRKKLKKKRKKHRNHKNKKVRTN